MIEYPIKKYDKINRVIYIDWNGVERCIYIYWDNTEKVKIKYRLYSSDAEVEAYDKNGKIIIKNASGKLVLDLPKLKIRNGRISYSVDKNKIKEWQEKLENKKNKS
jgi:hypothetical protein